MCGRFGLTRPERLDLERFGVRELPPLTPRYNIPPGSQILALSERAGERAAQLVHWGLIPSWARDPEIGNRLANARADTAFAKPSFRSAMKSRRCLIPVDVFYEWQVVAGQVRKQPHAIRFQGGEPFALGGIWEFWRPRDASDQPGGEGGDGGAADGIVSCAILTTEANVLMSRIHDRMPVIIPPERYAAWLDPRTPPPAITEMMLPHPSEGMESWPISLAVNSPRNDRPEILEPAGA